MTLMRWIAAAVLLMVSGGIAGMLLPRPLLPPSDASAGGEPAHTVLVLENPIHTDIALPIDDELLSRFRFLEASGIPVRHPQARWLIFGWGGRSFYLETPTWGDVKAVNVWKSFTLDRSVMHVDVAAEIPLDGPGVTRLELPAEGYRRLVDAVEDGFVLIDGRPVVIAGYSYRGSDRFFEGRGTFNAFQGCNTWTAETLRRAGMRTGWWNPLPVSLSVSLALFND